MIVSKQVAVLAILFTAIGCGTRPGLEGAAEETPLATAPSLAHSEASPSTGRDGRDTQQAALRVVEHLSAASPVFTRGLSSVLKRMPSDLRGLASTRSDSSIRYSTGSRVAVIEAMEAQDIYGTAATAGDRNPQGLLDRIVRDQHVQVTARCGAGTTFCVTGSQPNGNRVAVWLPKSSELALAAVTSDMDDLEALVEAWRDAASRR